MRGALSTADTPDPKNEPFGSPPRLFALFADVGFFVFRFKLGVEPGEAKAGEEDRRKCARKIYKTNDNNITMTTTTTTRTTAIQTKLFTIGWSQN